jgi:hypothetical protein
MEATQDISAPPVAPAAPILDDDEAEQFEAQERRSEREADRAREEAFIAEHHWHRWMPDTQTWQPYRLEPLSLDRWTWWHRMELHNAPLPRTAWEDQWSDAHVPTAWSLLYLCSHDADTILGLVPSPSLYWYAVNEWAAKHCPGELWLEALQLMRVMEKQTKATIATPRPSKKKRGRLGNALTP